jgi:hypothetical protein
LFYLIHICIINFRQSWSWLHDSWIYNYNVPMYSVPITTKDASLNPAHGEVYSIQHYVIKFVSDFRWFSPWYYSSSTKKTYHHDIAEILLKVALNIIRQPVIINSTEFFVHHYMIDWLIDWLCFDATFVNISAISWRPVLVVEEAGENHRPWASNW